MVSGAGEPPAAQSKKVCVVGGGLAGLAAARELRREGHAVTVLEQSHDVGGQWLYDPRASAADADNGPPVHSSVYASLRLVGPREIVGFSDFQFRPVHGRDARRFPGHREVHRFIKDFVAQFGLADAIKLDTTVTRVARAASSSPTPAESQWVVTSVHGGGAMDDEVFDAVVVATGHFTKPRFPRIEGMEEWGLLRRRQGHSHWYRTPKPYRGEAVVVVGCGDSGKDIALDLLRGGAMAVHVSAASLDGSMSPAMAKLQAKHHNLHLHPRLERLQAADGRAVFADGSSIFVDAVLYCTGYAYSFPFLDLDAAAISVDEEDDGVGTPVLFEGVFPPSASVAPSLSFVGIPRTVLVPRSFEAQARWVAQMLSGRRKLPPEEEMLRRALESQERRRRRRAGLEPVEIFEDGEEYYRDFPPVESWRKELVVSSIARRSQDLESFRDLPEEDECETAPKGTGGDDLAAAQDRQGHQIVDAQVALPAMDKLLLNV